MLDKYVRLIAYLRELRQNCKYSQQDVSLLLKKPQSFISKIENLNQFLNLNDFFLLSLVYKKAASEIISDIEVNNDK